MLTRRTLTMVLGGSLLSAVTSAEEPKKKKQKDRSGPVGAQDGKDDVKGAVWQIKATNAAEKKMELLKIRVHDGVIFNMQGKKAGVVSELGNTKEGGVKSKMVWREGLPLLGDFVITQAKKGVWGGTLKTKEGAEWVCPLEVLDR